MSVYILKRAEWLAKDEAELKAIAELKALEAFERKAMGNAESEGYAMEEAERTAMQKEAEDKAEAANLVRTPSQGEQLAWSKSPLAAHESLP